MAFFKNLFGKKPDPIKEALRAEVRGWARETLGNPKGMELTISEVDCPDPACPGTETFILVMRKGEATQAAKVKKPLDQVSEADVREALKYL